MAITLKVLSPQKEVLSAVCKSVTLPTEDGLITVLPKHADLFTTITHGELTARPEDGGREINLAVGGGFASVTGSEVTVLVDYGANADELDEEEIKKARERAEEILKHKQDDRGEAMAQASLARSLLELKVVRKRRKP